jgi:hypothetical protein
MLMKQTCTRADRGRSCGCREGDGRMTRLVRLTRSVLTAARVAVMATDEGRKSTS